MLYIIILLIVLFPVALYAVQYGILELAKLGILWDLAPLEGFARAYMRNKELSKMVLNYVGHEFVGDLPPDAPETTDNIGIYKIQPAPNNKARKGLRDRVLDFIFPVRGIVWKGWPGFYEVYTVLKVTWMDDNFENKKAENAAEVLVRPYVYGLEMLNVELEGNLEFNFKFIVRMQVTNPGIAWFRIGRYIDAVQNGIKALVIEHFRGLSWIDIVGKVRSGSAGGQQLSTVLAQAVAAILADTVEYEELFGVKVHEISIFDFAAANDAARTAITSEEIAQLKAKAEVAEAEGRAKIIGIDATAKADARRIEAKAEADAILAVNTAAESMSPNALRLRELHAIEHAGANVTLIGSGLSIPAVIPINPTRGN